ncbi:Mrp/NBP35 family ATP-binding protein [Candidatus Acetothermia bacterium]|jgi:ATP-binding protein involved in chromosome partitioning|nr:Mrp/NBP35 family ATP-binding protein [Candidatus Acetothermia bacterium]MCI2431862.1 Mrp/NBP35 family ATP-binding protein [Candidatus Acetothermia bacterium]MCI2435971.1 Mrp/NBP35 family ATP-binding protein [Candidatus Acetothermia bacterium]
MNLHQELHKALTNVEIPRAHSSLSELVEEMTVENGRVSIRVKLLPAYASKSQLRAWAEQAARSVPGVTAVEVSFAQTQAAPPRRQPQTPHPTKQLEFPQIKNIIAVFSGKGGVGKSTVSVNVAAALAQQGARVGLFDADVHGPNIPNLLGLAEQPKVQDGKLLPLYKHGLYAMSIGLLVGSGDPLIWRGPMISKAINELLDTTAWPDLDYLILDLPPGTGDAQLGLAQDLKLSGALAVTTPQEVALSDVRRGLSAFQKFGIPILGLIENMAYYLCPKCGHREYIFGRGGGEAEARKQSIPLLAQIPLDPKLREGGDAGVPIVVAEPTSPTALEFKKIAEALDNFQKEREKL